MNEDSEVLCSPRKIRRLEHAQISALNANQKLSQGSQESRATSTPAKKCLSHTFSIASDISSITQVPPTRSDSIIESDDEDDASELISLIEELSLNGSLTIRSGFLHRPNPRIFRGKVWKFFKPKYPESLYFKILENFDTIEDTVFEFLEELRSDERKGTLTLIKFFVDLCGYQSAQIDDHFDFDQDFSISCEKVIKLMEFEFVDKDILSANTYIFYEADRNSKLGTTLAAAVYKCVEKIIIGAYGQNILFSRPFHKYIFHFFFYMCQSNLRPIRHTGITLVRLTLKALNYIYPRIVKRLELGDSQHGHSYIPIEKEIEYAEKYIQHFYGVFAKNSYIPDVKLYMIRAKNVKEMGCWMIELPQIYFTNSVAHLFKLSLDESEIVRLSAVQVWKTLIKSKSLHLHVTKHLDDIVKLLQGRLRDVHVRVVVEAVDFFSILVDHYPKAIKEEVTSDITELLYANSYLYGKVAGFFTIKLLNSAKLSEVELLKKLVDISSVPKFQKMKHFFVESFVEHNTVLDNYKLMITVLLSYKKEDENDFQFTLSLIELMYYSIHQKLKGSCMVPRKHSYEGSPSSYCHEEIAKVFLLNFKYLTDLFQDKIAILNYLFKILIMIDFETLTTSYRPQFVFLMKSSRIIFLNEKDDELLGNICKLFHYLCFEKNTCIKEDLHKFLVNLFENLSSYLEGYLTEETQEVALDSHFEKIGKLYEKFNMNTFFKWNTLFTVWGNVPICRGQMISCQHFILWTIKELMKDMHKSNEDKQRMKKISLKSNFSEYVNSLVQLMTTPEANETLKLEAFETFCFLHLFSYEFASKHEELEDFKHQIQLSLKNHVPDAVIKFLTNNIIHNKSTTFERRKKLICIWLDLILNSLLDIFNIVPLFECYHTRSEEYGALIEFIAGKIFARSQEVFFCLILATLSKLASHVFQTLCRSFSSPEARQLMALTVKFGNMKQFTKASGEVLKMLHLGFRHCFKDTPLLELLVLLQNFLPKLTEEHQKACLKIFGAITPQEFENQEYVRTFRTKLQLGKKSIGNSTVASKDTTSTTEIVLDSEKSNIKTEKQTKKRVREGNDNKTKGKKSVAFDDSSKENAEENTRPKKKKRTAKSKKNKS
ncbi:uncharacterized protein LOC123673112 [Harmonia axyridis]|uniref:uncharacterized protein LOC123673112 n=1 Tax=Harmonia axyridis TaxID=115357 RepID=UPI001E27788F|nr:uncharacterized protein LOC123673112 [Harmonia axyridis]